MRAFQGATTSIPCDDDGRAVGAQILGVAGLPYQSRHRLSSCPTITEPTSVAAASTTSASARPSRHANGHGRLRAMASTGIPQLSDRTAGRASALAVTTHTTRLEERSVSALAGCVAAADITARGDDPDAGK